MRNAAEVGWDYPARIKAIDMAKNAYAGGGEYDYPNQMQQQMPVQKAHIEIPSDQNLWNKLNDYLPDWFMVSSTIVGAITLALLFFKFSKLNKYLASLVEMWKGLIKVKDKE